MSADEVAQHPHPLSTDNATAELIGPVGPSHSIHFCGPLEKANVRIDLLICRDVVLGTCTCTRVVLEYHFKVLVLVLVLVT